MCAFGIIIGAVLRMVLLTGSLTLFSGDTIPHVIRALFPRIVSMPVLFVFANRNFIIALCTITVSYPLSLYRDISKLARASALPLIGMCTIVVSVVSEGSRVPPELKGDASHRFNFR